MEVTEKNILQYLSYSSMKNNVFSISFFFLNYDSQNVLQWHFSKFGLNKRLNINGLVP